MVDVSGNIVVPSHIVQQYVSGMRRQGHQPQFQVNDLAQFEIPSSLLGLGMTSPHRHNSSFAAPQQMSHLTSPSSPSPRSESLGSCLISPGHTTPELTAPPAPAAAGDRTANSRVGLASSPRTNNSSNTYHHNTHPNSSSSSSGPAALPASSPAANAYTANGSAPAANSSTGWLPQEFQTSLGFDTSTTFSADSGSWLAAQQSGNEQQALVYEHSHVSPQRSRNPTPSIRVTTDFADAAQDFSQPQDAIYSASSASSLPPESYHPYNSYNHRHLSPHRSLPMPQEADNMQTPVSPVSGHNSPHDAAMADQQIPRKRSHSIMSQQDTQPQPYPVALQQHHHSRSGSVVSGHAASPNEGVDELPYSPRGSRAFKRGDPPTNEQGKYICDHSDECAGQIFDRKCEWSKHMDKHDRPYRCPHPSCAKLQGFTYSGGLLRHEREVHGKHGGPKAQLMCPHADCKRHTGKGFTRKENLNEHLRRVHPKDGPQQDSQVSQVSLLRRDGTDMGLIGDDGETPTSQSQAVDHEEYPGASPVLGKRKRTLTDGITDDKEEEIKRLRAELDAERAERIRLEADTYRYQEDIRHLQGSLMQRQAQDDSQPQSQQPAQEVAQAETRAAILNVEELRVYKQIDDLRHEIRAMSSNTSRESSKSP